MAVAIAIAVAIADAIKANDQARGHRLLIAARPAMSHDEFDVLDNVRRAAPRRPTDISIHWIDEDVCNHLSGLTPSPVPININDDRG